MFLHTVTGVLYWIIHGHQTSRYSGLSTRVLYIWLMQLVNGMQFLTVIFLFHASKFLADVSASFPAIMVLFTRI